MGLLDDLKGKAGELGEKAGQLGDKARDGLETARDKAAELVAEAKDRLDGDDTPTPEEGRDRYDEVLDAAQERADDLTNRPDRP